MKPHHFALCAVTCLVVLSSGDPASESANLAVSAPTDHLTTAVVDDNTLLSLAYGAGVLQGTRQQSEMVDLVVS